MASSVQVTIDAVDKASGVINGVSKSLTGLDKAGKTASNQMGTMGKATSALKGQFGGLASGLLGPIAGITTLGTAVMAAGKFVMSSVKDWAAYNEEIRKLGVATGASVEDLSRMMQAADDVGVSMDSMQTAMRLMAKNGIQPSVEGMAQLSDRLLGIKDDTARAEEMSKIFGRGWAEVAGFVLQGGDAIRDASAAIEDGLVVTDQSAQATRDYMEAVDALGDSWTVVKNNVAQGVTPALTDLMQWVIKTQEATKTMDDAWMTFNLVATQSEQVMMGRIRNFEGMAAATAYMNDVIEKSGYVLYEGTSAFDSYAEKAIAAKVVIEETTLSQEELNAMFVLQTEAALVAENALQTYNAMLMNTRNKAEGSKGALKQLEKSFLAAGYSAEEAAAMVKALSNQIAGLHDKEVIITVRYNMPQGGYTVQGGQLIPTPFSPAEEAINAHAYEEWIKGGSVGPAPTGGGSSSPSTETKKTMTEKEKTQRAKNNRSKRKQATGGSFIVPPGFPGDTYQVGLTSGERVIVVPQSKTSNNYNLTINSSARTENLMADFALLQVLNG